MGKKMIFQAILAQTKPTNAVTNPHVTLDGHGFSRGARMAMHCGCGQAGPCRKIVQETKKCIAIFRRPGPFWLGPAGLVLPGGVPNEI